MNKIVRILIILAILFLSNIGTADVQYVNQVVKVYDGVTGEPLDNVKVEIDGNIYVTSLTGKTDVINMLIEKKYTYIISKDGYDTQTATLTHVEPKILVSILNSFGVYPGYTTYLLPNGVSYPESDAPNILKSLKYEFELFISKILN